MTLRDYDAAVVTVHSENMSVLGMMSGSEGSHFGDANFIGSVTSLYPLLCPSVGRLVGLSVLIS